MTRNIDCNNFELVLNEVMDGRRSVTSEQSLVSHAEDCVECSELFVAYVELEHGLSGLELLNSPSNPGSPQVELADVEQENLRYDRYGAFGFVASVAVALAIMIFVSNMDFGERSQNNSMANLNEPANIGRPTAQDLKSGSPIATAQALKNPAVEVQPLGPNVFAELSDQISQSPYYQVSAELPYVRPLRSSIGVAIGLIQKSFSEETEKQDEKDPELGYRTFLGQWRV